TLLSNCYTTVQVHPQNGLAKESSYAVFPRNEFEFGRVNSVHLLTASPGHFIISQQLVTVDTKREGQVHHRFRVSTVPEIVFSCLLGLRIIHASLVLFEHHLLRMRS